MTSRNLLRPLVFLAAFVLMIACPATAFAQTPEDDVDIPYVLFTNEQSRTIAFTPQIHKQVVDTDGGVIDDWDFHTKPFSFTISSPDGSPLPEPTTATTDDHGIAKWPEVQFERGKTYNYIIKEDKGDVADVEYDVNEYSLKVTVADDGKVTKVWDEAIEMTPYASDSECIIKNVYRPKTSLVLQLQKKYLEKGSNKPVEIMDEQFSFTISAADTNPEAPLPAETTKKTNSEGLVKWEGVTFDQPGEWDYIVKESDPQDQSVIWDETEHRVHVSVTRNPDHTLKAEWTWDGGSANPTPTVTNYHIPSSHLPVAGGSGPENAIRIGAIVSTVALVSWFLYQKRKLRRKADF